MGDQDKTTPVNKAKLKEISKSTDNEKLKTSIDQKIKSADKPVNK
jgi:hypothetical protein